MYISWYDVGGKWETNLQIDSHKSAFNDVES